MKKTLTVIIALVLVLSFCFALVACNNNNGGNNNEQQQGQQQGGNQQGQGGDQQGQGGDQQGQGGDQTGTTLTQEQENAAALLGNLAGAYVLNNASAGVTASDLQKQLEAIRKSEYKDAIKSVSVKAAGSDYSVTIIYKNNAKKELTVTGVAADNGRKAGVDFTIGDNKDLGANEAIAILYNAVMATIEKAVEEGTTFSATDGFGFSGEAYFQFNYGELTSELLDYALSVKGNIGYEAKDTAAAIEVKQDGKVIGGLYYQGAAAKEDCKIYLLINGEKTFKYYIDNADVNALVASIIEAAKDKAEDIDLPNFEEGLLVAAEEADEDEPFYKNRIEKLTDLFAGMGLTDDIIGIVDGILNDVLSDAIGYTNGSDGTTYQVNLDLDALLDFIKPMLPILASGVDLETILPEPLNQIKLDQFQGIGGALLITAKVLNDGTLGGVEISYNVGKKDFRFNSTDDQPKVYGPVNVALGIKGFSLGDQTGVIPASVNTKDYNFFSPLNFEISGDVVVNEVEYEVSVKSDANPFAIEEGVALVEVVKSEGKTPVFTASFEMFQDDNGIDCNIVIADGSKIYAGKASDLGDGTLVFAGLLALNYTVGENSILAPIASYVMDLYVQFGGELPSDENGDDNGDYYEIIDEENEEGENIDETVLPAEDEAEEEAKLDVMGLVGSIGDIKDLVESWNGTVYTYGTNPIFFEGEVNFEQYNAILALILPKLEGVVPEEVSSFKFTEDAASVYANYNKGDYKDQAVVIVTYDDATYTALVDMTKFDIETGRGTLVASFTIVDKEGKTTVYAANFDNGDWDETGIATFSYGVKEGDADEIVYVDGKVTYVENGKSTVELELLANGNTYNYTFWAENKEDLQYFGAKLSEDEEISVYGGKGYFTYENVGTTSFDIPCVEMGCSFGWDFPSGAVDVEVKSVKLVSWGETVEIKLPAYDENALEHADPLSTFVGNAVVAYGKIMALTNEGQVK